MTAPPLMGPPGAPEWADVIRAVLRDWAADGRLSDGVLRRMQTLLARHSVGDSPLLIPVPPSDARPLMPPDRRLPARVEDVPGLSDEERAFLIDFARNATASRRVWRMVVWVCGGVAAIAGAIAGVIALARTIGPGH